jgi:ParB-like chromosome segregation protein Spo0J
MLKKTIKELIDQIKDLPLEEKIEAINEVRKELHEISPFKKEPVDLVLWVKGEAVEKNEYNPNSVAPKEMDLLKLSIEHDGYTQPVVCWNNEKKFQVVDGFHRNRVGKEYKNVREKIYGYLPITLINEENTGKNDRVAATIRHNRARGQHSVDGMSSIILELKRRNWNNEKISKHLGMEPDEILRLSQIVGLAEMFRDQDFSKAWTSDDGTLDLTQTVK